ncbi:MBL fold metallo-hydrolase [Clostridium sp.]|uniref:MBL fold metallo-hydrolase n=1 Tax=Clostridium sp. TaxID=1506 RepID=UPI002848502D|nr:MBL fold metallo-hydrolase [Clostridium sp.]MDR3595037.1 MBL fold metallo-hydrolase [Clostridium sp.]
MVKITFLGTNGWFDSNTGSTTSILIEHKEYYIILDAGNGISKLSQYVSYNKPVYLFLSHFHMDHISGLHTLYMNRFLKGLYIIVQEGGTEILKLIINAPFTVPIEKLPFNTQIIEVCENIKKLPFKATFLPLVHTTFTLGARLEIENRVITYCTDTSYCDNAVTLAQNADVLIAECSMRPNEVTDANIHLNPELSAKIAKVSGAKKLILMHFDASRYVDMESRIQAEMSAKEIFKYSSASWDGFNVEV